jgi:hypothetical protein
MKMDVEEDWWCWWHCQRAGEYVGWRLSKEREGGEKSPSYVPAESVHAVQPRGSTRKIQQKVDAYASPVLNAREQHPLEMGHQLI